MAHAIPRRSAQPRGLLLGVALVLAGTFALVTLGHDAPTDPARVGERPSASRDLRFADRADGAIVVSDARTGREVQVVQPGEEGFVRGAMRGFVRERRRESIGPDRPFRLSAWSNGRVTLEDTATGHVLELHAFGRTNAEAFVRLLATEE